MANERITENLVRNTFRELGYYDPAANLHINEQRSDIEAIRKALAAASKTGGGGKGAPEFIVSDEDQDFVLIFECKADPNDHASPTVTIGLLDGPADETSRDYVRRVVRFAADGALHYARALSKSYNVIAVAVSGTTTLKVSAYLHTKDAAKPKALTAKTGGDITTIIPWADYIEHATFDPSVQAIRLNELMAFSRDLHDFMRSDVKASESEKPLFVSGTLIALRNRAFARGFSDYSRKDLPQAWLRAISDELERADIPNTKLPLITLPYRALAAHPELPKEHSKYPKGVLHELIKRLNAKVWPFIEVYHDFDVVGQFYGEFLKYTGGDKKALGIVLTPRHITELFSLLANVNKNSVVLDICAGTGGFLITAMHHMFRTAVTEAERSRIKREGLIGVEQQPNMFTLAASNMLLRGDGKANLYQANCLEKPVSDAVKKHKCTIGLLNPPFSQDDKHELEFVLHMLDLLKAGGTGVAVVPISCVVAPHQAKYDLLQRHTLEGVMSLPIDLFAPVGVITCAMVFTAHVPHATSNRRTWFGYWRDDGFVRTKHLGRIDQSNRWRDIRDRWVESFRNRDLIAGESVMRSVTHTDEWCAEAYMETDYTTLGYGDFERELKKYVAFQILHKEGMG